MTDHTVYTTDSYEAAELGYSQNDTSVAEWPADAAGAPLRVGGEYTLTDFDTLPSPLTYEGHVREVRLYEDGAVVVTFEPRSQFAFTIDLTDVAAEFATK